MNTYRRRKLRCERLEDRRMLAILGGAGEPNPDDTDPNVDAAQVRGLVWNDLNGNGHRESGEAGMGGVVVYSDLNFNGQLDPDEPRTKSSHDDPHTDFDEGGFYALEDLRRGFHVVRQVAPDGFVQTFPAGLGFDPGFPLPLPLPGDAHVVLLYPGQSVDGFDFGNQERGPGSAHGRKWEDLNGNGQREANEPGLAGVTIYSDLNRNGRLDEGEPHAVTMEDIPETDFDEAGLYWLDGLHAGRHVIREVVPDGFAQTFPMLPVPAGILSTMDVSPSPMEFFTTWRDTLGSTTDLRADWNGDQVVDEQDYEAWKENMANGIAPLPPRLPGAHVVDIVPGQAVDGLDFGNQRIEPGSIHGRKWNDRNGNGHREANEPGLAGVTIYSDLNFNGVLDDNEPHAVTMEDIPETDFDEAGLYWLSPLRPGFHVIREVVPDGFRQTFPLPFGPVPEPIDPNIAIIPPPHDGAHFVFLASGETIEGIDFGNQEILPGSIHGTKWLDANGNAQRDPGEPGLPGVIIYIDVNGNGVLDDDEPHTRTMEDIPETDFDEAGMYWIDGLPAGVHLVREVVPDGFRQTFPFGGFDDHPVPEGGVPNEFVTVHPEFINETLAAGQVLQIDVAITVHPFLIRPYEIDVVASDPDVPFENLTGIVVNGGGGDTSTFEIQIIGDGAPRDFDLLFVDSEFGDVLAEIPVWIRPPFGNGAHRVILEPGGHVEGIDFGNQPIRSASVHGRKWEDLNGNGQRENNEPGLPGVVIYSDLNFNGVLDDDEPHTVTMEDNPFTDFDEGGLYWLDGLRSGRHIIREVVPDGFLQTFPGPIFPPIDPLPGDPNGDFPFVLPGAHQIFLEPGQIVEGLDFGNQRIEPNSVHGRKWEDLNGNAERDPNEPGLPGVVIYSDLNFNGLLDDNEPHTITMEDDPLTDFDEAGLYWLDGLRPGTHFIREVVPDGFQQTFPLPGPIPLPADIASGAIAPPDGVHVLFLGSGQVIEGIDFGNQRIEPGSVHGLKWVDVNGNALRDPNEPGMAGVVIYSDLNFNGVLDDDEPHTVTMEDDPDTFVNEAGRYWLDGLRPGDHFIREVVPDGFVQTYPGSPFFDSLVPGNGFHHVFIPSGGIVEGVNFGNQEIRPGSIHGTKWLDANGNAERDPDEPGLPGVTIYIDVNFNGQLDPDEPRTVTMEDDPDTAVNEAGNYWLENVRPGRVSVREVVPDGFVQTFPVEFVIAVFPPPPGQGGSHELIVRNGEVIDGVDFGNQRVEPALASGLVWNDLNGNGQRELNEPGMPGVTVYSDLNFNGVLDDDEPRTVTIADDATVVPNDTGRYRLGNLRPGTHAIRQVVPDGFVQTFPSPFDPLANGLSILPGGAHFIFVESGDVVNDLDFGNRQFDGMPGDFNVDGIVNATDMTLWRNTLGQVVTPYGGADGNGNGVVDEGDYEVWKEHFGQQLPAPTPLAASAPTDAGFALLVESEPQAQPVRTTFAEESDGAPISDDTLLLLALDQISAEEDLVDENDALFAESNESEEELALELALAELG